MTPWRNGSASDSKSEESNFSLKLTGNFSRQWQKQSFVTQLGRGPDPLNFKFVLVMKETQAILQESLVCPPPLPTLSLVTCFVDILFVLQI